MDRQKTFDRLDSFLNLKAQWDGYDAYPIDPKCVEQAKELLNKMQVQPIVMPISTGGIQFELEVDDPIRAYFEIEIDPVDGLGEFFILDKLEVELENRTPDEVLTDFKNFIDLVSKFK